MLRSFFRVGVVFLLLSPFAFAAAPKVGRTAAAKYFEASPEDKTKNTRYVASEEEGLGSEERYLAFGVSTYASSDAFNWGKINKEKNVGKLGFDMTYRLSQSNYIDYALRVLYTEYAPFNEKASKMSFMYAVTLPDAGSKFPLYFGAAAGAGVFFTQLEDESRLSLDYQLFLGLRIFNLFDKTGFYVEGGMKNHLQLTSDGQLNGTYVSAGAVFTF
ncbi:MAG: hypothetical protein AABY53_04970 [Bdellovibrionota bacterium]